MELHTIAVISTSHLSQDVARILTAQGNNNPWVSCSSWEHGFFLHLEELEQSTPQCLIDIRNWLRSKELPCSDSGGQKWFGTWIRLDGDAEPESDLPRYDW